MTHQRHNTQATNRTSTVRLVPWGAHDLPLLAQLLGDPETMAHLGGPESPKKIAERQARYERMTDSRTGRIFKVVDGVTGEAVGSVGFWERDWRAEPVYEIGWFVL